jgi:hypothetical protein
MERQPHSVLTRWTWNCGESSCLTHSRFRISTVAGEVKLKWKSVERPLAPKPRRSLFMKLISSVQVCVYRFWTRIVQCDVVTMVDVCNRHSVQRLAFLMKANCAARNEFLYIVWRKNHLKLEAICPFNFTETLLIHFFLIFMFLC